MSEKANIRCACCMREPIHNAEMPDWLKFHGRAATVYYCPEHRDYLDTLKRDERGRIVFTYRGGVERGCGRSYEWHNGYSPTTNNGGIIYPWMTLRECQDSAKSLGCAATFQHDATQEAAR